MATKQLTDQDAFTMTVEAADVGARGVLITITDSQGRQDTYPVVLSDVLTATRLALVGDSLSLTNNQIATVLRRFVQAARTAARTAGGWN